MTAPDPGLTDLIAAHWRSLDLLKMKYTCSCGDWEFRDDDRELACASWCEHLALVVEQHTNGRITELEAGVEHWKDRSQYNYDCGMVLANEANARAEKAEATIARVRAINPECGFVACTDLRAALEGEQQ
ncbi:hypothetical protein LRQ08_21630 [Rhodococcus qingshengii]|uniref:hypothetical protein n=1 Tax=Rhodococcus qingshengii TaxID=334542 RepID=UPI00211165FE|nr:hypothetical protein [Rhodococcus qingshengii]UUE23830.1 hypothetical protein LRQ08_21630 [Rhodococcus qingshengii]